MTNEETVLLARYVKALCPQQAIDAYTPDAWHEVLGHLNLDECHEAVTAIARRQPFVSPSEIIREIAEARSVNEPHSVACRESDHRDCRVSWCGCVCHAGNVARITAERGSDPLQLGRGFDNPDSPWGQIGMGVDGES